MWLTNEAVLNGFTSGLTNLIQGSLFGVQKRFKTACHQVTIQHGGTEMKRSAQLTKLFSGAAFLIVFFLLFARQSSAQVVSNVSFQVEQGNIIKIDYYLSSPDSRNFDVSIFASTDGGQSFFELKSLSGDFGNVSGSGTKTVYWKVTKDVAQFAGSLCKIEVRATKITTFGDAAGEFFSGSEFTKRFVNGFAVYAGWLNTVFTNSSFKSAMSSGFLTNAGGWNGGVRYVRLPFILDGNYVNQTFRAAGSESPIIYQGMNLSFNFALLPVSDYFDAYVGLGFQASELSMSTGTFDSNAQTNGVFWSAGAQVNPSSKWRLGIQYSGSFTAGNRNWNQLMLIAGYNFSIEPGVTK